MPGIRREIAFYAPMKAPDHPVPSGDRQIARLSLAALARAGYRPRTVSDLRIFDKTGDPELQQELSAAADATADRLIGELSAAPPALWFTYHCHYKAPDLIGPQVSKALGIPYVISEPSISPRRHDGPWAGFARASEAAIARADRLFWTTRRDLPALEAAGHSPRLTHLPAFVDPGPEPRPHAPGKTLRLLTVAMMRPGDKLESYRRLARALAHLSGNPAGARVPQSFGLAPPPPRGEGRGGGLPPTEAAPAWHLDIHGAGEARPDVEAAFAPLARHVTFHGATDDSSVLREAYEAADLFVWPGVGEGVGMVYLEAQAAGLPVVAEAHVAQRELVIPPLAPPDDPASFAQAITALAARSGARQAARAHVLADHSIDAAAKTLGRALGELAP